MVHLLDLVLRVFMLVFVRNKINAVDESRAKTKSLNLVSCCQFNQIASFYVQNENFITRLFPVITYQVLFGFVDEVLNESWRDFVD